MRQPLNRPHSPILMGNVRLQRRERRVQASEDVGGVNVWPGVDDDRRDSRVPCTDGYQRQSAALEPTPQGMSRVSPTSTCGLMQSHQLQRHLQYL